MKRVVPLTRCPNKRYLLYLPESVGCASPAMKKLKLVINLIACVSLGQISVSAIIGKSICGIFHPRLDFRSANI